MTLARTWQANQWADFAFHEYVVRKLRESAAEVTEHNVQTVYSAILTNCLPAGNA